MQLRWLFLLQLSLLVTFGLCSMATFGQKYGFNNMIDTSRQELKELKVIGFSNQKFMVGQYTLMLDSSQIANNQLETTSNFLQFQIPIAFKSYGTGQATSMAFRGTSPNHTAVLWNGININSPTLGQTDFSLISLANFDKITVQFGAAGSTLGSDAIGGSIALNSSFSNKNSPIALGLKYASFQNYAGSISSNIYRQLTKDWQLSSKTQINWLQYNNRFPYSSLGYYPIEFSSTVQKAITQDLFFLKNNGKLLAFNAWLTTNMLVIEPPQVNNLPQNIELRETTQTASYRFLVTYTVRNINVSGGFIRDILNYGKGDFSTPDHSTTDRIVLKGSQEFSHKNFIYSKKQSLLKIGGEISNYSAKVDGYGNGAFNELRGDAFVLWRSNLSENLITSINVRQAFVTGYDAPLAPSIGLEYKLFETELGYTFISQIKFTANVGKGYRVPTLNERYWKILGNPYLKPETSVNKEIGVVLSSNYSRGLTGTFNLNCYYNLIDNWIYWNPENAYHAENLLQVLAKGFETFYSLDFKQSAYNTSLRLAYAYTNTSQQNAYNAFAVDLVGKQLPFIPQNTISLNVNFNYKKWNVIIQNLYYSKRFVNADNSGAAFPPYYLLNLSLGKKLLLAHSAFDIVFQGNNITNTIYPNLKKNAMPTNNFSLGVYFKL